MNDVLIGVLFFAGLLAVSAVITTVINQRRRPWTVEKHPTDDGRLRVMCVKPGEVPWIIGTLRPDDENRGLKLAELRAEAEEACIELNAGRDPRR